MSPVDHEFRRVTEADIVAVARDMRHWDQQELLAGGHTDFEDVLRKAVAHSDWAATSYINGQPACISGVVGHGTLTSRHGIPWMLGSTLLDRHSRTILTVSPELVHTMLHQYGRLQNYVYENSRASVRWLRWLGFEIHPAEPFGPQGQRFHRFTKRI